MRDFPYALPQIKVLSASDVDEMRECIETHKPFIAKGLANAWPLMQEVSQRAAGSDRINLFTELFNGAKIPYSSIPPEQEGDFGIGEDLKANFRFDDRIAPADEFFKAINDLIENPTGACVYAQSLDVADYPDISSRLTRLDSLVEEDLYRYSRIWFGSGNQIVDLHYDNARNFIAMIEGVKRITLFPPEALPYIYPAPLHRIVGGVTRSLVKLLNYDQEKFPKFESALKMAEMTLVEPGDILHIPPLWWHHVESYDFNVMVNSWYDDNDQETKDKIASERTNWKKAISRSFYGRAAAADAMTAPAGVQQLPKLWRDYFNMLYDYYVTRKFGDPYPTVPGALPEVARSIRYQRLRNMRHQLAKSARKLFARK